MKSEDLFPLVAARFAVQAPTTSRRKPVGPGPAPAGPHRCDTQPCHFGCWLNCLLGVDQTDSSLQAQPPQASL